MLVALAWCANDSGYRVSKLVRRPRPEGHGIVVERRITGTFGFPSGHVVHSTAVFGFLLFLTGRHRRSVPAPAVWLARLLLLPVLLTIDTSRIVSGEHWPSDVLGGRLLGGAWLALFVHLHRRFTGGRAER
jgi:undecaprenyl-diphosphatase